MRRNSGAAGWGEAVRIPAALATAAGGDVGERFFTSRVGFPEASHGLQRRASVAADSPVAKGREGRRLVAAHRSVAGRLRQCPRHRGALRAVAVRRIRPAPRETQRSGVLPAPPAGREAGAQHPRSDGAIYPPAIRTSPGFSSRLEGPARIGTAPGSPAGTPKPKWRASRRRDGARRCAVCRRFPRSRIVSGVASLPRS